MEEPSLKISSVDIGKVLTQITEGHTQECQRMGDMVRGRFDEIMSIVEANVAMMVLVQNCVTNPNNMNCLGVFRQTLSHILENKKMKSGEKTTKVSDLDGAEEIAEEDPLGELGSKIQTLYLNDWHSGEKVAEFVALSIEFINIFIAFYTLSNSDDEDEYEYDEDGYDEGEYDDEDPRDSVSINPFDLSVIKITVSAAQSYLEYLNTHKENFLEERNSGRWDNVSTLMNGLRGLSFRTDIGKYVSTLEYKYFSFILELIVKWDVIAIEIGDIPKGEDKT